ncbi:Angiogenic factor with G patch and FHA domains 1 [Thoreauomyces humboldtii]|nr:Angiogenic factor with G patch and FHA domains 1 [Thoreauomyces humboldtii]
MTDEDPEAAATRLLAEITGTVIPAKATVTVTSTASATPANDWTLHRSGQYYISKSSPWCYSEASGYFYFDARGRIVKQGEAELPQESAAAGTKDQTDGDLDAFYAELGDIAADPRDEKAKAAALEDGEVDETPGEHNHNHGSTYDAPHPKWDHSGYDELERAAVIPAWEADAGGGEGTKSAPDSDAVMKLVVTESHLMPVGSIVLVDASGVSVGRDTAPHRRLVLKDINVSRFHCSLFVDRVRLAPEPTAAPVEPVSAPGKIDFDAVLERAKASAARFLSDRVPALHGSDGVDVAPRGTKRSVSDRDNDSRARSKTESLGPLVDCFFVTDVASTHGTFVNGKRLSEPKKSSQPHRLEHGDTLTIGGTTMTAHIHAKWGCDACRVTGTNLVSTEPIKETPKDEPNNTKKKGPKASLEAVRRQELNRLRREALGEEEEGKPNKAGPRDGVHNVEEDEGADMQDRPNKKKKKQQPKLPSQYVDRAAMRRQMHGVDSSDPPPSSRNNYGKYPPRGGGRGAGGVNHQQWGGAPVEQAPFNRTAAVPLQHAEPANVGTRMLQKMGWTAGQGLGAQGNGRVEPVNVKMRQGKTGLGMGGVGEGVDVGGKRETLKEATVRRARERFREMCDGDA